MGENELESLISRLLPVSVSVCMSHWITKSGKKVQV